MEQESMAQQAYLVVIAQGPGGYAGQIGQLFYGTALVSAFAQAYHAQNSKAPIFNDSMALSLLGQEEYGQIAGGMALGISFFNPFFTGAPEAAGQKPAPIAAAPFPLLACPLLRGEILCLLARFPFALAALCHRHI